MKKEFVTYEQALKLKELWFNEPCVARYTVEPMDNIDWLTIPEQSIGHGKQLYGDAKNYNTKLYNNEGTISAPLKQQVFSWFRKKGYDVKLQREYNDLYFGFYWTGVAWLLVSQGTYDEVESELIDKLIDIAKK
jgi:hypothetical protein